MLIPSLLHIIPLPKQAMNRALPLMEVPVERELAPFLVSSLRSVTWVSKTSQSGFIRTAFRPREGLETELLEAIVRRSQDEGWDSVHPWGEAGAKAAIGYLHSYGLEAWQAIAHLETKADFVQGELMRAVWVPKNLIVFVPQERLYLGTLHVVNTSQVAAVVHNPSRGIAFCRAYSGNADLADSGALKV